MKRIIVPLDFSACSINALRYAVKMRKGKQTDILLIHAVEYPEPSGMEYGMINGRLLADQLSRSEEEAQRKLDSLIEQFAAEDVLFSKRTTMGSLLTWVANELPHIECDLIIMGTTGASELKSIFLGSRAEKVIRNACCSVLAIPREATWKPVNNLVVPFESSGLTEGFFDAVKEMQDLTGATLQLLWVNTPHAVKRESDLIGEMAEFVKRHGIEDYRINTRRAFSPALGILNFLEEVNGDLVAMATHGRKGLNHLLFDSVTEEVVNRTDVPIWTFRAIQKEKVSI